MTEVCDYIHPPSVSAIKFSLLLRFWYSVSFIRTPAWH